MMKRLINFYILIYLLKNMKINTVLKNIKDNSNYPQSFSKEILNEFPDEIEDSFIEKFYQIENNYIGDISNIITFYKYKEDIQYLVNEYLLYTGKIFKLPRSKLNWIDFNDLY